MIRQLGFAVLIVMMTVWCWRRDDDDNDNNDDDDDCLAAFGVVRCSWCSLVSVGDGGCSSASLDNFQRYNISRSQSSLAHYCTPQDL